MKRIWDSIIKSGSRDATALVLSRIQEVSEEKGAERRIEKRFVTDAPGIVAGSPASKWTPCRVLDVSRSGLRIRSDIKFEQGAELYLMLSAGSTVVGEVRYSRPAGAQWDTGLKILSHSLEATDNVKSTV